GRLADVAALAADHEQAEEVLLARLTLTAVKRFQRILRQGVELVLSDNACAPRLGADYLLLGSDLPAFADAPGELSHIEAAVAIEADKRRRTVLEIHVG